jgi:hypothetical protein
MSRPPRAGALELRFKIAVWFCLGGWIGTLRYVTLPPSELQPPPSHHSTSHYLAHPRPRHAAPRYIDATFEFADSQAEKACALRVCMKTVPGPVNLHTRPSPAIMLEMMPPDATRSRTYLQFHATRWPLSMMYFSSFWSCAGAVVSASSTV